MGNTGCTPVRFKYVQNLTESGQPLKTEQNRSRAIFRMGQSLVKAARAAEHVVSLVFPSVGRMCVLLVAARWGLAGILVDDGWAYEVENAEMQLGHRERIEDCRRIRA